MKKLAFAIDAEAGWPPVSSESVWCEEVEGNYRLVNTPFFISGLAFGDVFSAEPNSENEHVTDFEVIDESGHSVVWLVNNVDADLTHFKERLLEIGCSIEGMVKFSLYSIDVPPGVSLGKFDQLIDEYQNKGVDFAFPVWRNEE